MVSLGGHHLSIALENQGYSMVVGGGRRDRKLDGAFRKGLSAPSNTGLDIIV